MPKPKRTPIFYDNGTVGLPLRGGKVSIIDVTDAPRTLQHGWSLKDSNSSRQSIPGDYAHAKVNGKTISLHRFILQPSSDLTVDHINGDGLDNRRSNLRLVTQKDNSRNRRKGKNCTSQFKGVHMRENGRWRAAIRVDGVLLNLGTFITEDQAAVAYDIAALKFFGNFAKVNFP